MIAVQAAIIFFLLVILGLVLQDEYRKKLASRKAVKLNRFWPSIKERRKSLRIDAELDVYYEVISAKNSIKLASLSRNISLGGINLTLNEKLAPDTALNIELSIPGRPKPIFLQGKTVWAREISAKFNKQHQQRFFATGIKFTQMKPNDEALLREFINQHNQETKIEK
jgi:c-di-GMP-binding flagellar brake protein YcgR